MKRSWVLSREALDGLLEFLDGDRERAADQYERIRRRLIYVLEARGAAEPEALADETIDRVARKLAEGTRLEGAERYPYFHGVALRVLQEHRRAPRPVPLDAAQCAMQPVPPSPVRELLMEQCLERLDPKERVLLDRYFQESKRARIENRRRLASELGLSLNSLRIRIHRILEKLESCVNGQIRRGSLK